MNNMFEGCESLKLLDLSHFNMTNINKVDTMFKGVSKLSYINIYYIENLAQNIIESELEVFNSSTVCQKDNIISNCVTTCLKKICLMTF